MLLFCSETRDARTWYKYLRYSLNRGRKSRAQGQRQGRVSFFDPGRGSGSGMQQWLRKQTSWWAADVGKYFRATCSLQLRRFSEYTQTLPSPRLCPRKAFYLLTNNYKSSSVRKGSVALAHSLPAELLEISLNRVHLIRAWAGHIAFDWAAYRTGCAHWGFTDCSHERLLRFT